MKFLLAQVGALIYRTIVTFCLMQSEKDDYSKGYMLKIMKDCEYADTLTREEKFSVFCKVCDNMLESGRLSNKT